MMTRLTGFPDLLAYLEEVKLPHRADPVAQTVEIPTQAPPLVGRLVVRWEKRLPYLQLIHPMLQAIPVARRTELEHAICLVNNAVPLPGFGLEYERSFLYLRLCIPLAEEGLSVSVFRNMVSQVIHVARQHLHAFQRVVAGAPAEQILDPVPPPVVD